MLIKTARAIDKLTRSMDSVLPKPRIGDVSLDSHSVPVVVETSAEKDFEDGSARES